MSMSVLCAGSLAQAEERTKQERTNKDIRAEQLVLQAEEMRKTGSCW